MTNITVPPEKVTTVGDIVGLSILFFVIGAVGAIGNFLVIFVIVTDRKMRSSVTNLFIMNLAVSDFIIMLICVPDFIQFMMDKGWQIGLPLCKTFRYIQCASLYASVMTLVSVCVERYIAIIHPVHAHLWCSKRRVIAIIVTIWPIALVFALPQVLYHQIIEVKPDFYPCILFLPGGEAQHLAFKYTEFTFFYLVPMIMQVVLYSIISVKLFASVENLHASSTKKIGAEPNTAQRKEIADAMATRKGVVKMLIVAVTVYFVCFSPHQILLFYNTFSTTPFVATWTYLIFVNIMAYASSAANPLLYSVFSQKFREKFKKTLCCCFAVKRRERTSMLSFGTSSTRRSIRANTAISEV